MKTILCYGDSNTWGYEPGPCTRYAAAARWPGVLRRELGEGYAVIEEGLNGRTTVFDDPVEGVHKNGRPYLLPCLETHAPLDLVVLMLGTNDLKTRFNVPPSDIAAGAGVLVGDILRSGCGRGGKAPKVLLVAPAVTGETAEDGEMFKGAREKSKRFAGMYRLIAEQHGVAFLNANEHITTSEIDGIHLEPAEHEKLGAAVAGAVRKAL
jgi:lysophospholipase L1-like esterase